jgi:hypothetical protein
MNFVPKVPNYTPMSFGQGYGDWQQYAGFNKSNPFGALPDQAVAPPVPATAFKPDTTMPTPDYAIKPPASQFGAPSTGFDVPSIAMQPMSLADQAKKYFGD